MSISVALRFLVELFVLTNVAISPGIPLSPSSEHVAWAEKCIPSTVVPSLPSPRAQQTHTHTPSHTGWEFYLLKRSPKVPQLLPYVRVCVVWCVVV
uniref:Putative secreted protein n=1 Tax=Anopheles triannulatus TaxID=58253 RepID=A0A2M4B4Z0_9DIPT